MAAGRGYPAIHVATAIRGVASYLTKSLPGVQVIEIELEKDVLTPVSKEKLKSEAKILLGDAVPIISSIMQEENNLKWAHSTWAGVDGLIKHIDKQKPFPSFLLTRSGGAAFGKIMADYVMGYIIAHERHLFKMRDEQNKRIWNQPEHQVYRPIHGLSIGILGIGDIGKEVARCCKCLGMTVWGMVSKLPMENGKCDFVDFYRTKEQLPELLQNCDHVCNVLPSTPATIGLLSGDMLLNCRDKRSFIINIGRGDIMAEYDIVKAVRSGWISGAALDVFEKEPLPDSSALWSLANVHITPHIAGTCLGELVGEDFAKNYHRYVNNQPLSCVFNWENQY